jgi:hypothetical protein
MRDANATVRLRFIWPDTADLAGKSSETAENDKISRCPCRAGGLFGARGGRPGGLAAIRAVSTPACERAMRFRNRLKFAYHPPLKQENF